MGSVTTRDEALHLRLKLRAHAHGLGRRRQRRRAGAALAADARSCATTRRTSAGRALAQWWRERPEVAAVLHPALAGSPGHEHWQRAVRPRPRACSRWSSTSATRRRRSTPSSMRCSCSASAIRGPARSAWSCPTTCAAIRVPPGVARHAGALLGRAGSCRRPDRRLRAGARRARARLRAGNAGELGCLSVAPAQTHAQADRTHRELQPLLHRSAAVGASTPSTSKWRSSMAMHSFISSSAR